MPGVLGVLGEVTTVPFGNTENPELAFLQSSEVSYRGQLIGVVAEGDPYADNG